MIDDKLKEIIRPHIRYLITKKGYRELKERGETAKDSENLVIAQIKQAFDDEGWHKAEVKNEVNLTFDNDRPELLLTGSEWLARFKEELEKEYEGHGIIRDIREGVLRAAKRASKI